MLKGSIAFSSSLCREVQEETGIAVKTSSRVGVYSNPTVNVAYIAKLQEAVEPHAGSDAESADWKSDWQGNLGLRSRGDLGRRPKARGQWLKTPTNPAQPSTGPTRGGNKRGSLVARYLFGKQHLSYR